MEEITQLDIDRIADVVWWIKGYHAACEDESSMCDFDLSHVHSLTKIKETLQAKLNKEESNGNK